MMMKKEDQIETKNTPSSFSSADADQLDGDLVYNVPDGLEDDPEIIRSELMFFNTPRNDIYSDYVYYTLKNIQLQCANDFEDICEKNVVLNLDLNAFFSSMFSSPMNAFFNRRHLAEASRSLTGAGVINNLRSVFYNTLPNPSKHGFQIVAKTSKKDQDVPIGPIIPNHTFIPIEGNEPKASLQKEQDTPIGPIIPPHIVVPDNVNNGRARRSVYEVQPPPPPPPIFLPPQPFLGDAGKFLHPYAKALKTAKENEDVPVPIGPIIPPNTVIPLGPLSLKKKQDDPFGPIIPPHIVEPYTGNRPMLRRARRSLQMKPPPPHPKPLPPQRVPGDTDNFPPSPIDGPKGNRPPPPPPGDHRGGADGHHDHKDHHPSNGDGEKDHHHGFFGGAWDSDSDSDGDSDSEDMPKEKKAGGRPHRGPPIPEDKLFSGALGFGAEGDMCLYQNLDQLSDPCISAVSDLYALRANYWAEDQTPPPPRPCHAAGWIFGALALFGLLLLFKKLRLRHRKQQVNQFLAAVTSNPELKAIVEQQTQLKVPEPHECGKHRCCTGVVGRLCKTVLFGAFVLGSSFFIAVSSLEITAHLIHHIDESAYAEGAAQQPGEGGPVSAFAALLILTAVCAIHVALFFLFVRVVRYFYLRNCPASACDSNPSAPLDPSSPQFHGKSPRFFVVRNKLHQLKSFAANVLRRPAQHHQQSEHGGMYAPLLMRDDGDGPGGEMVALVTPSGQVLPVAASPVTTVNMV